MEGQVKITADERKRLDRQRFIGLETQRKLLSSRILITPANGPNTELAKNLVLAGVNITLYDNEIATEDDFETNFLVGLKEIGQKRGEVIFERLKQMNPSGINEFFCESINENELNEAFLSRFSIVCTSFSDLTVVQKWDKATKKANKPFYNIFSAGVSSACFISLGSCYTYKQSPTKPNPKQYQIESLSLEECLQKQQVKKSRRKQFQIIQAMINTSDERISESRSNIQSIQQDENG